MAANLVGPNGKVLAFEPEPTSFELISKSVTLNQLRNITLFRVALSDSSGQKQLFLASRNAGGHSLMRDERPHSIPVESMTLDDAISRSGISSIDVIKLDVEGAEPHVLYGAQKLLTGTRPLRIIMEYDQRAWDSHQKLMNELFDHFDIYEIIHGPFLCKRTSMASLARISFCNLYLSRPKS